MNNEKWAEQRKVGVVGHALTPAIYTFSAATQLGLKDTSRDQLHE